MRSGAVLLRAADLHKRFGAIEVRKGIDLELEQGEVVALISSSGSGKTTFLRCINLLEAYERGQITIAGEPIGDVVAQGRRKRLSERAIAAQRARIGMVFQQFNLFPHLTALRNVMLRLVKVQGRQRAEAEEIAAGWLARVGLADRREHDP